MACTISQAKKFQIKSSLQKKEEKKKKGKRRKFTCKGGGKDLGEARARTTRKLGNPKYVVWKSPGDPR